MSSWWAMLKSDYSVTCGVKFLLMLEGLACTDFDMRGTIGMSGNFLFFKSYLYQLKLEVLLISTTAEQREQTDYRGKAGGRHGRPTERHRQPIHPADGGVQHADHGAQDQNDRQACLPSRQTQAER